MAGKTGKPTRTPKPTRVAGPRVEYRITFVEDPDAQFEESNGEARPLTEAEYAGNEYRACPDHPRAGGVPLDVSKSPNVVGCAVCKRTDWADIPYAEYLEYYGNPDRHVYVQCDVERKCPCCGTWTYAAGLGHIDFMDDSKEIHAVDVTFTEAEIDKIPGYLQEVARETLEDAKAEWARTTRKVVARAH